MTTNKKGKASKGESNLATGLAVGAGLIAAVAGGYFLYGPQGKNNRKRVRAWGIKARGEVLHELEKMKDVTADTYSQTVDKVMTKYGKLKEVSAPEIEELKSELKRYWKKIVTDMKGRSQRKTAPKKKTVTTKKTNRKK